MTSGTGRRHTRKISGGRVRPDLLGRHSLRSCDLIAQDHTRQSVTRAQRLLVGRLSGLTAVCLLGQSAQQRRTRGQTANRGGQCRRGLRHRCIRQLSLSRLMFEQGVHGQSRMQQCTRSLTHCELLAGRCLEIAIGPDQPDANQQSVAQVIYQQRPARIELFPAPAQARGDQPPASFDKRLEVVEMALAQMVRVRHQHRQPGQSAARGSHHIQPRPLEASQ